jgi:hypothetical protein
MPPFVRGDQPNGHEPLAQRNFAVLEDGADLDRKPLAAIAALVGAIVGEMIDLGRAAIGAMCAGLPPDRAQMVSTTTCRS